MIQNIIDFTQKLQNVQVILYMFFLSSLSIRLLCKYNNIIILPLYQILLIIFDSLIIYITLRLDSYITTINDNYNHFLIF